MALSLVSGSFLVVNFRVYSHINYDCLLSCESWRIVQLCVSNYPISDRNSKMDSH